MLLKARRWPVEAARFWSSHDFFFPSLFFTEVELNISYFCIQDLGFCKTRYGTDGWTSGRADFKTLFVGGGVRVKNYDVDAVKFIAKLSPSKKYFGNFSILIDLFFTACTKMFHVVHSIKNQSETLVEPRTLIRPPP